MNILFLREAYKKNKIHLLTFHPIPNVNEIKSIKK
jgi:hypothetical protein